MRMIDKEKLLYSVYKNTPLIPSMAGMTAEEMRLKIATLIDNFDSIEIIQCKDCKWYDINLADGTTCFCTRLELFNEHDWFCADGERRTE